MHRFKFKIGDYGYVDPDYRTRQSISYLPVLIVDRFVDEGICEFDGLPFEEPTYTVKFADGKYGEFLDYAITSELET